MPRELDHAGGVEGAGAPARRGGTDKAVNEEERDRRGDEEVAVESHGAARWEEDEGYGEALALGKTTSRRRRRERGVTVSLTVGPINVDPNRQ